MTNITKEKNGVALTSTVCSIVRGDAKGQTYPAFIPTPETLNDYITAFTPTKICDILARSAKADAQAALDFILGDEGWKKRTVVGEDGKESVQLYYDESSLDIDKVLETILAGTVRGGVTKAQLEEEFEELNANLRKLISEANPAINPGLSDDARQRLFAEAFSLAPKIQELEAAIASKSKTRRTKEEMAAAAAGK